MYEVRLSKQAENFIDKLAEKYRNSAIETLQDIGIEPKLGKKLGRELKDFYSIGFGKYRVVYKIMKKEKYILVTKIEDRKVVYN